MLQQHSCYKLCWSITGQAWACASLVSHCHRSAWHGADRPLVLLTPKYLHHHRPATSALHDMTSGTFFNRVIDDGKVSSHPSACCFDCHRK